MTLTEIKEIFNIDLVFKSRKAHLVYLRGHYIDQELLKERKQTDICLELQCNHATVYHYLQRKEMYKKIKEYNKLKKAFDRKDVNLLKQVVETLLNKTYITYNIGVKKVLQKNEKPFKRWNHKRITEALRKDNKNELWNKPMPEFTINDYKILEDLENGK